MRRNPLLPMFLTSLLCLSVALPSAALAMPKNSTPKNCGIKDAQSIFGSSCVDQSAQDIAKGHSYTHILFCGGDTMLCCTVDNTTDEVLNCRKPAGAIRTPGMKTVPYVGSIRSRGVEGEEEAGEATPVPKWVTETLEREQASSIPSK